MIKNVHLLNPLPTYTIGNSNFFKSDIYIFEEKNNIRILICVLVSVYIGRSCGYYDKSQSLYSNKMS